MSDGVKDLRSLPLFEIIGAPLIALVQAQTQAARATVEFIEKVGFDRKDSQEVSSELNVGTVRMAEFRYTKMDENREPAEFVARVPVLSLVPIPGIQMKNAKISFTAKITDVYEEEAKTTQSTQVVKKPTWLKEALTQFRGSLAPEAKTTKENLAVRGNYELNIEVELEQLPIAAGIEKILSMMDQAITDDKKGTNR